MREGPLNPTAQAPLRAWDGCISFAFFCCEGERLTRSSSLFRSPRENSNTRPLSPSEAISAPTSGVGRSSESSGKRQKREQTWGGAVRARVRVIENIIRHDKFSFGAGRQQKAREAARYLSTRPPKKVGVYRRGRHFKSKLFFFLRSTPRKIPVVFVCLCPGCLSVSERQGGMDVCRQHLLVPLVRVTRVLPGLRTWKMEGALMSYHSLRVMGSTLQLVGHVTAKQSKGQSRKVSTGVGRCNTFRHHPVSTITAACLPACCTRVVPKQAASCTDIERTLQVI